MEGSIDLALGEILHQLTAIPELLVADQNAHLAKVDSFSHALLSIIECFHELSRLCGAFCRRSRVQRLTEDELGRCIKYLQH
jgi:hypothetical protein